MSRPRIRTVKPELWQDEKVGQLSRDARLLLIGLVTMADDEGRLRALPALILGHAFPYDTDAPKRLDSWLEEIVATGMVLAYESDGTRYVAFRHWARHQRPNKPVASTLPEPPDAIVVRENSVTKRGTGTESSGSATGGLPESSVPSRAIADRNGSEGKGSKSSGGAMSETRDSEPPPPPSREELARSLQ